MRTKQVRITTLSGVGNLTYVRTKNLSIMTKEVRVKISFILDVDAELSKNQIQSQIESNLEFGSGIEIIDTKFNIREEKDIYEND